MNVAFINENTLGHTSYLPRFVAALRAHPEWECIPHQIDAVPLPPNLRHAERGIRGLGRFGLDWLLTRWRRAASANAARQLSELRATTRIDALVVNTQSVGLDLPDTASGIPAFVALDATFEQLARSPWFAPTRAARWFHPLTLASLRRRERALFRHAAGFLPWSRHVADSLRTEYGVAPQRIHVLPPSMSDPGPPLPRTREDGPTRLLFIGGDFKRKGGPELLEAWRRHLRPAHELDIVTHDDVGAEPGLRVHRGTKAGSPEWLRLWREADVLVFPSHLETFGIVLVEAMAFGVPFVATRVGAASELAGEHRCGRLLDDGSPDAIAAAVRGFDRTHRLQGAEHGRAAFLDGFEIGRNAALLRDLLRQAAR